jgi:predicted  nucleic acid-binding Zn-ribbon protein
MLKGNRVACDANADCSSYCPAKPLMKSDAATKVSMDLLRTLHRIHRQLTDLNGQLRRGPLQIKASEDLVAQAQAAADDSVERLKKAKLAADNKQLQLKGREDRVQELKTKLNTAASNREYGLLKDQISADESANEVLSDEIFEALERLDVLERERVAAQAELKRRQEEAAALGETVRQRMTKLEAELTRVQDELREAEDQLPPAMRLDYQRIVAARGEEGLAPVYGENCGGCHQTLTSQMMNRLYLGEAVRCPPCGAMLYLPEDRTVR